MLQWLSINRPTIPFFPFHFDPLRKGQTKLVLRHYPSIFVRCLFSLPIDLVPLSCIKSKMNSQFHAWIFDTLTTWTWTALFNESFNFKLNSIRMVIEVVPLFVELFFFLQIFRQTLLFIGLATRMVECRMLKTECVSWLLDIHHVFYERRKFIYDHTHTQVIYALAHTAHTHNSLLSSG